MNYARVILVLCICLLLSELTLAVGFANPPKQREFVFEPGEIITVPITVVGASKIDVTASPTELGNISTLGTDQDDNIQEYIRIEDSDPLGPARETRFIAELPDTMKPGLYRVNIYAREVVDNQGGFVAVAVTQIQLRIWVLSPERLAEITSVWVPAIAEGMDANISVRIVSRTSLDIASLFTELEIIEGEEVVATTTTLPRPLLSGETVEFSQLVDTKLLTGGDYYVNVTAHYADRVSYGPIKTLKIGTLHVDVSEYTKELVFNATNRFIFNVSNQWNNPLKDVYAKVKIGSQEKQTASIDIPPFGKTSYEVYFDRDSSLVPGAAKVNVTVVFQDLDPQTGRYVERSDSFSLTPTIVQPVTDAGRTDMKGAVMMSVLVVLILLLGIVMVLLLRRGRRETNP